MDVGADPSKSLRSCLSNLFENARLSVCARLSELGVSTTYQTSVSTVDHDGTGWASSSSMAEASLLLIDPLPTTFTPLFSQAVQDELKEAGRIIADGLSIEEPLWSGFPGRIDPYLDYDYFVNDVDNGQSVAEWVTKFAVIPALIAALKDLPRVDSGLTENKDNFAIEVISILQEPVVKTTGRLLALGPTMDSSVVISGSEDVLTLRPLTNLEIGKEFDYWGSNAIRRGVRLPNIAIEVSFDSPVNGVGPFDQNKMHQLLAVLRLCGYTVTTGGMTVDVSPRWPVAGVQFGSSGNPFGDGFVLTEKHEIDRSLVLDLFGKISRFNLEIPNSVQSLALHRYSLGCGRASDVDAVLDFVIALEAVLLPYDSDARHGDLAYRFRIHGALLIGGSADDRANTYRTLNRLYGVRSNIVHGSKYPEAVEIRGAREIGREVCRKVLLAALACPTFPSATYSKELLLGKAREVGP